GARLWVGDRLLINSWRPMRGYSSGAIWLPSGMREVRMEYYECTGVALARLDWQLVSRP
ncbi:MAG: glycosyl hydrolase, partial [Chloroflexi bacterium]